MERRFAGVGPRRSNSGRCGPNEEPRFRAQAGGTEYDAGEIHTSCACVRRCGPGRSHSGARPMGLVHRPLQDDRNPRPGDEITSLSRNRILNFRQPIHRTTNTLSSQPGCGRRRLSHCMSTGIKRSAARKREAGEPAGKEGSRVRRAVIEARIFPAVSEFSQCHIFAGDGRRGSLLGWSAETRQFRSARHLDSLNHRARRGAQGMESL